MRTLILALLLCAMPTVAGAEVFVFAAASTTDLVRELAKAFTDTTGKKVTTSFTSSSAAARQIENGAPADVYISANQKWMDYLEDKGFVRPGTRVTPFRNRLVLVSAVHPEPVDIKPGFPLLEMLGEERLAMGDPVYVPAGSYARQALESLGVWDEVADQAAFTRTVRAALAIVERKEAPYGIVYATDARLGTDTKVVGTFPENTHKPIIYHAAVIDGDNIHDAWDFIKFLRGEEGQAIVKKHGFEGEER